MEGNTGETTSLRKGAIGTWQGVFQSFSFVGPAADVAILLIGTFAFAGASSALSVLLAWLIYGLWMITPYQFSKFKANAGSYYSYAAGSTKKGMLGPPALVSWMGENLTGQSFGILGFASFIYLLSSRISSIPYIWVAFSVAITLYMFILPYLGIRPSLNYVAVTGFAEAMFLLLGSIIIIVRVGHANTLVPFTIPAGALSAVLFGTVFSILDFTGLGTVTTTSEEIRDPKKRVRRSLIIAWALSGLALIPAAYALTVGWGIGNISSYASSPDPGLLVFRKYLGVAGFILLIIFTANSYFSYGVAKTNAVSRIWFSAARDGVVFPKGLSRVHRRYRTPSNAMLVWLTASFVIDMILGSIFGPENGALILLTTAGIAIIFVHIYANTGLSLYYRSLRREDRSLLYQVVAPTVSSVLGIVVIFYSVQSTVQSYTSSPSAINLAYLVATVVALVLGAVIGPAVSLYYSRSKPAVLERAGEYDAESSYT
ncbi:APC family permease [Thermogymnomonas acidicola]|nr:APC family permease [Thermogymnomonas acidicola]